MELNWSCSGWPGLFPDLRLLWADSGYAGALETWVAEHTPWVTGRPVGGHRAGLPRRASGLDIVRKDPQAQGFAVLPQRWIGERTFAWLGRHRRLSKDYKARPDTSEAWIYVAVIDRMWERLTASI